MKGRVPKVNNLLQFSKCDDCDEGNSNIPELSHFSTQFNHLVNVLCILVPYSDQSEKHYPNGTKEIRFPNQTIKYIYPNGEEESVFPNGSVQKILANGDCTIQLANGQKEFHTKEYKVG